jgi:hypothetical protein
MKELMQYVADKNARLAISVQLRFKRAALRDELLSLSSPRAIEWLRAELEYELEPENISHDGERSSAVIRRETKRLTVILNQLNKVKTMDGL